MMNKISYAIFIALVGFSSTAFAQDAAEESFFRLLPGEVCKEGGFIQKCFDVPQAQCLSEVTRLATECTNKLKAADAGFKVLEGDHPRKVGECIGENYAKTYITKYKPDCQAATK